VPPLSSDFIAAEKRALQLELRHLGQEIHDTVAQEVSGVRMSFSRLEQDLREKRFPKTSTVARFVRDLTELEAHVHDLAEGLFPVEVEAEGLGRALERFAEKTTARHGVACTVRLDSGLRIDDPDIAVHLYRIVREAVHNALKHAQARSIAISARSTRATVTVAVRDDGIGFDPESETGRLGLRIMRQRAQLVGATLRIKSARNAGTTVTCRVKNRGA